jgi:transcription elongation factor GreB
VTPAGLAALEAERDALEEAKAALPTDNEDERRRSAHLIDGKLLLLNQRIASARVLDPAEQPREEVRFGATVTLRQLPGKREQQFQIVGVDEANVKQQKISFTAPIARAVTGLYVGEVADFRLGDELRKLEVIHISY